jgi:hypothetical protein
MPIKRSLVLAVLASLCFSWTAAAQTASGQFSSKELDVEIQGAYSYWDKSGGFDDAQNIKVVVSNAKFRAEFIDRWYDRRYVISELFADEEVKVVHFEFSADGRYRGYSYYFGSGDGCGYCFDSTVGSTVRVAGGRLAGKITSPAKDGSVSFAIEFDVPIPQKTWGEPLPAGGGDLAKIYAAYHTALEAKDVKTLKGLTDARYNQRLAEHEKAGDLQEYLEYRWEDVHMRLANIKVTGGFVRGDYAVLLIEGSNPIFDNLSGDAIFTREGGTWRMGDELLQIGKRQ